MPRRQLRFGKGWPGASPCVSPRAEVRVYGSERHVLLRHYMAAGLSKTAIAARLGLDRSTIHRWIPPGITAGITSMSR